MNRYWVFQDTYIRRDLVESLRVSGAANSWDLTVRTVSGQNLTENFTTQAAAEAERDRVLAEEI